MKKNDAIKLVTEKVTELKSIIASLKTNDTLSKATRGTQLYARGRERRVLNLISSLLSQCHDDVKLSEADMNTLVLITTLASERVQPGTIEAKVGEPIFAVAKRYPNKTIDKLTRALERSGLTIDESTGLIKAIEE